MWFFGSGRDGKPQDLVYQYRENLESEIAKNTDGRCDDARNGSTDDSHRGLAVSGTVRIVKSPMELPCI